MSMPDELQARRTGDHWRVAWPIGGGYFRLAGLPGERYRRDQVEMRHNRSIQHGGIQAVAS